MRTIAAVAAGALSLATARIDAQVNRGWYYSVTPYFWMADLDGHVGVNSLGANVDLTAGNVLNDLRFAGAVYGEARVKSYVMGLDAMYRSIGASRIVSLFGDSGTFHLATRQTMLQPTVGYTVGGDSWGLDFLGGIRYWNVNTQLDLDPLLSVNAFGDNGGSRSWVDATGGLRLHMAPFDYLRFNFGGDGGGGGARSTWQAYGSLGLDVASWCTLDVSYRGLGVDYDTRHFLHDVSMQGVSVATMFRFFGR